MRPIPNEPDQADEPTDRSRRRLPPHNLQAEEALLGACLLSRDAPATARNHLRSTADCYSPAHGLILEAALALDADGIKVDPITVGDYLTQHGTLEHVGGHGRLLALQASCPAAGNAEHYARSVAHLATRRRLLTECQTAVEQLYGTDRTTAAVAATLEQHLGEVGDQGRKTTWTAAEAVEAQIEEWERIEAGDPTLVPLPWTDLATLYQGGYRPGELHVIGARPAKGKSQMGVVIGLHAARHAKRVLFVSLEMSARDMASRWFGVDGRVLLDRIRSGALHAQDWERISPSIGRLSTLPMWVHDDSGTTVADVTTLARRFQPDLVIVDYLGLIGTEDQAQTQNRNQEISAMTRSLKVLAGRHQCAVLLLSQLNRNVEGRVDRRPTLADLRDSGQIEADANSVAFIWRDPDDRLDLIRLDVQKQRSGRLGEVRIIFDGEHGTMEEAA